MNYEQMLDEAYKKVKVTQEKTRFEIPKVKGCHEGNRTAITNFLSIATHIRRDPVHVMKFLSKELASPAEIKNERLLFNGKLSSGEVNKKIIKYVNEFVLCKKCQKPDTEIVEEGNKLFLRCLACGKKQEIHKQ